LSTKAIFQDFPNLKILSFKFKDFAGHSRVCMNLFSGVFRPLPNYEALRYKKHSH